VFGCGPQEDEDAIFDSISAVVGQVGAGAVVEGVSGTILHKFILSFEFRKRSHLVRCLSGRSELVRRLGQSGPNTSLLGATKETRFAARGCFANEAM
jgi:hypothetical protein